MPRSSFLFSSFKFKWLAATAILGIAAVSTQCSLIAKTDLKKGIGVTCTADDECQDGTCVADVGNAKVCATKCVADDGCPAPSICLNQQCRVGAACKNDAACGAGAICDRNVCRPGCRNDGQCTTQGQ